MVQLNPSRPQIGLVIVRFRFQRLEPRGPEPESDRGSVTFDSDLHLIDPELHNFAKILLFRAHKMMIHLGILLLSISILVTTAKGVSI